MAKAKPTDVQTETAPQEAPASLDMAEHVRMLQEQVLALTKSQVALIQHMGDTTAAFGKSIKTESKEDKTTRRARELSFRIGDNERRLAEGAEGEVDVKYFRMTLSKEPRMLRIVGAKDELWAQKRFLAHFGITRLTEQSIVCEELAALPPLDEWPADQKTHVLRGLDATSDGLKNKKPELAISG